MPNCTSAGGCDILSRGLESVRLRRFASLPLLMLWATVFVAVLSANQALATCGDYLLLPEEAHDDTSHEPQPCDGPECRGAPSSPLPVPAPFRIAHPEKHGVTDRSLKDAIASCRTHRCFDIPLEVPDGWRLRIERPPRI